MTDFIRYNSGFGNTFSTEARSGALPQGQNNPQKAPFGLYAEQISGSAFTVSRKSNLRTWAYRMRPSVVQGHFEPLPQKSHLATVPFEGGLTTPNPMRWMPLPAPTENTSFWDGLYSFCGNGGTEARGGCTVHEYSFKNPPKNLYYSNSDGEMLIVPQQGTLLFFTEMGRLEVSPLEIAVIPRGIKFRVEIKGADFARGYICENHGAPYQLPDRGPIGANGLANERDFLYPTAHIEENVGPCELHSKLAGKLWKNSLPDSPLDVVAWWGTYAPYKYDLRLFNTMNTVSYDHPDPCIFIVLHSPSTSPGTSNIDFVIFPPRWMVAENTFRPPYYHRNVMSEFMGLIEGAYDAKEGGFVPGGASLHNMMTPHGPDRKTFDKASEQKLEPERYKNTMAFMFETFLPYSVSPWALQTNLVDKDYVHCWNNLNKNYKP